MIRVVKLGGSLLAADALPDCLNKIAESAGQVVIVPGGGMFADQVRSAQQVWGYDDATAHAMAILAMQQMALLMRALQPGLALTPSINALQDFDKPAIWSPDLRELDRAGIPASWSVTSDSLAAWLARCLRATKLIVVKSCVIPQTASIKDLQQLGILDAGFLQFSEDAVFNINILNKDQFLLRHD